MEELTYDPVLDSQTVPRWRLLNPLRPPAPGRALVLVPDSGVALTVHPGEEIPDARFGTYQSVFTVDLTEHRLVLEIALLSRDATFSFRSRVDVVCRVADPAEVVARGIRDMSGALYGHLRRMLRQVSRDYDIGEFHEAEEALNRAVRDVTGDSAVRLRNIHVELLVDEDEIAASGREFRDVVRETRLDGMRRKRHLDMIRDDGVEGIIAEIMEREGPAPHSPGSRRVRPRSGRHASKPCGWCWSAATPTANPSSRPSSSVPWSRTCSATVRGRSAESAGAGSGEPSPRARGPSPRSPNGRPRMRSRRAAAPCAAKWFRRVVTPRLRRMNRFPAAHRLRVRRPALVRFGPLGLRSGQARQPGAWHSQATGRRHRPERG